MANLRWPLALCTCSLTMLLSVYLTTNTRITDLRMAVKHHSRTIDFKRAAKYDSSHGGASLSGVTVPWNFVSTELRDKVASGITREETIQIFLPGIPPEKWKILSSASDVAKSNQTRSVPQVDSCSIVGNSGVLLESNCGDVIDQGDLVVRMNLAPAGGEYSRDVGSKTNLTTINFELSKIMSSCAKAEYTNKSHEDIPDECQSLMKLMLRLNNTVIWYFKAHWVVNLIKEGLDFYKEYYNLKVLFAYSPAGLLGPTQRWLRVRSATTGAILYLASHKFCRRITLFGFYPRYVDPTNRTLRYHYYDDTPKNYSKTPHSFNKEFKVWQSLENDGYLRVINDCAGKWDKHDYRSQLDT
ncbi:alpha-2,8-sialyltransferase 8B-like [Diadema setosum]|uniref:alpha-2,8-sialyltransferase 8B-like n=1 Tax=Diadema setosum TaxID=31175 RepID=UPI003B3AB214